MWLACLPWGGNRRAVQEGNTICAAPQGGALPRRENGVGPEVHFRHEGETSGIGDAAAKALARMLARNDALTVLWLGSCEIGDEGARALASVLCDDGRAGQARSKANVSLTELDIRENQLSEGAKEELRVAAASRPGFTLRV